MKKNLSSIMLIILAFVTLCACTQSLPAATLHAEGDPGYIKTEIEDSLDMRLTSKQCFVYDVKGEKFIYIKGNEKVLYPASTTKLLTALYALTLLSPDEIITPGDELELVGKNSSIAYIKTHHQISVEMLIEGMIIPSGNDAAYALAAAAGKKLNKTENDISGKEAVELFMDGMRAYADSLGLCGSYFSTPDGNSTETYSTIEDMALIAREAYKNTIIMKYAGMYKDNVTYASGHINTWTNTNEMLNPESKYYSKRITGLKTGSLGDKHNSLICTIKTKGGNKYIVGIFSADSKTSRFSDMDKILKHLKDLD